MPTNPLPGTMPGALPGALPGAMPGSHGALPANVGDEEIHPIDDAKKAGHAIAETVRGAFAKNPGAPPTPAAPKPPSYADVYAARQKAGLTK